MALGTLRHLLATDYLRRGDGIIATADSRRKERLFGVTGNGRTCTRMAGVKLETLGGRKDVWLGCFSAVGTLTGCTDGIQHESSTLKQGIDVDFISTNAF